MYVAAAQGPEVTVLLLPAQSTELGGAATNTAITTVG